MSAKLHASTDDAQKLTYDAPALATHFSEPSHMHATFQMLERIDEWNVKMFTLQDSWAEPIEKTDLRELVATEQLKTSIMAVFCCLMHAELARDNEENRYAFVNPRDIAPTKGGGNGRPILLLLRWRAIMSRGLLDSTDD
ncbi:hypothetical protein ACFE04_026332 [Oxalis oulophora]